MAIPTPLDTTSPATARAQLVLSQMDLVRATLADTNNYVEVRPYRWAEVSGQNQFETGYSHGEGRIRVYLGTAREPHSEFVLTGREDDLAEFIRITTR